jgi:hypothetical protein
VAAHRAIRSMRKSSVTTTARSFTSSPRCGTGLCRSVCWTGDQGVSLRQPTGKAPNHVGAHRRRDEGMPLAKTAARCAHRVQRVDAGRSSKALQLCRHARRQGCAGRSAGIGWLLCRFLCIQKIRGAIYVFPSHPFFSLNSSRY